MANPRTPGVGITGAAESLGSDGAFSIKAGPLLQRQSLAKRLQRAASGLLFLGCVKPPHRVGRPSFMPSPRTAKIAKLVARLKTETGREPTDVEIARMLAIGVATVRRHRDKIARRGAE